MARRTINRMEKRAEYEAYERRQAEDTEELEDEEEDEDEEEAEEEEAGELEEEAGDEEEADEEEAPPKKKKKAKEPKKAKPRSRAPKVARMRLVWGVFNNSNVRVATFDYPKKREAEEHAAKLTADKKQTHFVQPVKEPIDEKKES
jgi:hypothetical protein